MEHGAVKYFEFEIQKSDELKPNDAHTFTPLLDLLLSKDVSEPYVHASHYMK